MKNLFKKFEKNEDGVLIVEATYVFPIVILVVFLMIYVGNAYLQKCKVESIVIQEVVKCAAYCGDPMTEKIEKDGIPEYTDVKVEPYRFLIGGMEDNIVASEEEIADKISGMAGGLFRNMKVENAKVDLTFKNAFIYSTIIADITYEITLPIKMMDQKSPTVMKFEDRVEMPVADTVELIRNVDMIEDFLQRWEVYDTAMTELSKMVAGLEEKLGKVLGGE